MIDIEDEEARSVLRHCGFELVDREVVTDAEWIERWHLSANADFSADYGRSRSDASLWLRSEHLGVGPLSDVWLHAATGATIDLKDRQGVGRQLEILVQFLPTIEEFVKRAAALSRLSEADKYVVKLFFPRS